MKLEEKTEKELKKYLPVHPENGTWSCGFRIGFRSGYFLAYEEATEMLKKSGSVREKESEES